MRSKPIHICILTIHPIDDVRVNHKIGQAFSTAGFRVTWIGPDYAFFDAVNYNQYQIEYQLFPPHKGKLGRFTQMATLFRKALALPDVQVLYVPDPDTAWLAAGLSKLKKVRVIFDVHEVFHTEIFFERWLRGPLAKAGQWFFKQMLLQAASASDLVVGVGHVVLEPFSTVSTEKLIVRSCAPAWFADGEPADVCGEGRETFTLMHGKADLWRGTRVVLEALSLARQQIDNLRCIMIDDLQNPIDGFGADEFRRLVVDLNLENVVELRQGIPMSEMPAVLRTCDAGLIAYGRKLGFYSLPNKLFEYMATGLPVIAPSYAPEIARILEAEQCGLMVDFEDPAAVAQAIVQLCQDVKACQEMGRRAREAFEQRHNWEVEARPMLERIRSWYPAAE